MPSLDSIVFEHRNKEYGAYRLRQLYARIFLISFFSGMGIFLFILFISWYRLSIASSVLQRFMQEGGPTGIIEFTNFDVDPVPVAPQKNPMVSSRAGEVSVEVARNVSEAGFPEEGNTEQAIEQMINSYTATLTDSLARTLISPETEQQNGWALHGAGDDYSPLIRKEDELKKHILAHLHYPDSALRKKLNGMIVVQFLFTKKGNITDVLLVKSVHPLLDREALKAVHTIPPTSPVVMRGKPVEVLYRIPIVFKYNP